MNKDLVTISRLALSGSEVDLRLFLAKHVRKIKSTDIETANAIEELLKSQSSYSSSVLRKTKTLESPNFGSNIDNNFDDEISSLIKIWDSYDSLEEIYLSL